MIQTVRHFNTNIKSIFFGNYSMIPYRKVNIKIKTNNCIYTIVNISCTHIITPQTTILNSYLTN